MTSLKFKLKVLEKLTVDNSPLILTAVGVVGTVATAVLTHKAALKTHRVLLEIEDNQLSQKQPFTPPTTMETVKATWVHYIPPVAAGTLTIGAIVMSNRISTKRAAALATAMTLAERAHSEYKDKIAEKFGQNKADQVRTEIAQDQINANPPNENNVILLGKGDILMQERYTGRYIRSSIENVKRAVNEVNYQINSTGSATLSDFYDKLEMDHTSYSDEVGWDVDKLMDVDFDAVIIDGREPCITFNFVTHPARYRFPK